MQKISIVLRPLILSLTMLASEVVFAQTIASNLTSKITEVLVYPGGARVERVAKVAVNARELKLVCLSASFDIDSMQVQSSTGIRIGDINVQTLERTRFPECATSELDQRIRTLQQSSAAIESEIAAQELTLDYLRRYGNDKNAVPNAITSTTEQLQRNSLALLQKQVQARQQKEELELQLKPLIAERDQQIQANPYLRTVQIRLAAAQAGEVRLSYRIKNAGWTPVYRAYLNTKDGQVRLERHAQVAQTSGEDWHDVQLRLSTVQPKLSNALNPPSPWRLDIRAPEVRTTSFTPASPAAPIAYAVAQPSFVRSKETKANAENDINFDVSVFQGAYAAEYVVPGNIHLSSSAERVNFSLDSQTLNAKLWTRIQPQQLAQAYLLADIERPKGSWPSGALQLYRDGEFIGQNQLQLSSEERQELYFGRDDMVRVLKEPELRDAANTGFIGNRNEKKYHRAYVVENLHTTPIQLQVLEASPVASHEDIKVQSQFMPQPDELVWHKQPGIVAWQPTLAAGKSVRLTADYTITYPKDALIIGLP